MTSSGTYAFAPSIGDLTLNAFARIGLRRPELQQQHFADAAMEANLLQVEFSNRGPNLWKTELYSVSLVQGTASYTLLPRFLAPMAVYMTTAPGGSGAPFDRVLGPLSTFEYAALPDKTVQAPPTSYWYERLETPVIWLWPVPDGSATYTLNFQMLSQPQDASIPSGVTPDVPYRWFDAFAAALAARLAAIYKPEMEVVRAAAAERAWQIAAKEDIEYVPMFLIPGTSGYFQ